MTLHVKWEQEDVRPMYDHIRYSIEMTQDMTGDGVKSSALIPVSDLYDGKEVVWIGLIRKALQKGLL